MLPSALMSKNVDTFAGRLEIACSDAGIAFSPTAIGDLVEMRRQSAALWMQGSLPRADVLYRLADALRCDSRWLATGHGDRRPKPVSSDLAPSEEDLLARYRGADPRWQLALRLMAALATEDQIEFAADVNVIIARLLGRRPKDLRYPSDAEVEKKIGLPPGHVRRVTEVTHRRSSGQQGKRKHQS